MLYRKNKQNKQTLLYVEDRNHFSKSIINFLERYFTAIYIANDGEEALDIYYSKKPDIIITDIEIPKMNGLRLISKIREKDDLTPIIIATNYSSTEYLIQAVELNLVKYFIKPVDTKRLHEGIDKCLKKIESTNTNIINITKLHQYDIVHNILTCNGKTIPLTLSQRTFLNILIKNRYRTVSYLEIENYIWGDRGMSEAALRSLVYDIRKIFHRGILQNISKTGYRINIC